MNKILAVLVLLAVPFASVAEAGVTASRVSLIAQPGPAALAGYRSKKGKKTRGSGRSVAEACAISSAALGMNAGGLAGIQGPGATSNGVHVDHLPMP